MERRAELRGWRVLLLPGRAKRRSQFPEREIALIGGGEAGMRGTSGGDTERGLFARRERLASERVTARL